MKILLSAVVMFGCMVLQVSAQTLSQEMEFTPGPRMIRAIEHIAGSYAHLGHSLALTAQQKQSLADLVQRMKTDMWMK
ncbi:MAG TPA: hypothetical protein VJ746_17410, partial [Nitrospira sp.]|nr:hypothetical protein [Nitrospira sp.]